MEFSLLNLLLVLLAAWLSGQLAARYGYPSVLGELLAGMILGPPLLGVLEGGAALAVLAEVGILLMMVYIGMEIDPEELRKASKAGLLAALGGFITPFVLAYLVVVWSGGTTMAGIFVGIAAGVTSLATKSRILVDLKLLDTRIAHVMMAGALIADTLSLIIFAAVIGVAETEQVDAAGIAFVTGKALLFFAIATALGLKGFPYLGRWLQQQTAFTRTARFTLVLLIAFVYAEMAELAGMHGILGAFLAGLFLRDKVLGRSLSKEIQGLVRDVSIGFLAPVFFVTAGFAVSFNVFATDLGLLVLVIGVATFGKILGTALFYLPTGFGWREGLTVGAGMNGRGAVEIIVAQIGLSMGLIDQTMFSILVFMALFTTATVPVFLKWGAEWLRRRGELTRSDKERKGVVLVGAGPTARAIGGLLAQTQPVWLVDRNREYCELARADGLNVVQGNALDEQVLSEAQAAKARHFIVLTANTEVNALVAQLARTVFLVPDVHLPDSGDPEGHAVLAEHLRTTTLFGGNFELTDWDYHIAHLEVEHTHFEVDQPEELFESLQKQRDGLPVVLQRNNMYYPFHSGSEVQKGDLVHVLQVTEAVPEQQDQFDRLATRCPVLDIEHPVSLDAFFGMAAGLLAPRLDIEAGVLAERLQRREKIRNSVLLPGLAIPHVVIPGEGKFEMLIARAQKGVSFFDDAAGVQTLFVLVGTKDERMTHLRVLSAIAQIVQRVDFEKDWLGASDADALRDLVVKAQRRRLSPEEISTIWIRNG